MEAGRELDGQIAALLGDRLITRGKWRGYWDCGNGRHYSDEDGGPLHYSTDIAAAWLVVTHLRERGLHLQMNDTLSAYRARFFTVASTAQWDRESADGAYYQFASTAPHAICLASLKAVGAS